MVVLLSVKEALKVAGMSSRIYVWKLAKEGRFPAPVRISGDKKHRYFLQNEVVAWAVEREARKRERAKRSRSRKVQL